MREIAAEVFGDARLKGRVERILKRPPGGVEAVATLSEEIDFAGLSETEQFRLLFERRMAEHWARGEGPSMTELRNLMDVRWRLDQMEVRDRLHARRETRR
jgi:hypothetical protein